MATNGLILEDDIKLNVDHPSAEALNYNMCVKCYLSPEVWEKVRHLCIINIIIIHVLVSDLIFA